MTTAAAGGGKDAAAKQGNKESTKAGGDKGHAKKDTGTKGGVQAKGGGKSIADDSSTGLAEESFSPDFPDMVVFASFVDLPIRKKVSASTEVADRRERLRLYNLNHDHSNPAWLICTRDMPLHAPAPPAKIPVWKTIRQRKKHVLPTDEPVYTEPAKPDMWVELKSPYVGLRGGKPASLAPLASAAAPMKRANSRFSRGVRSRQESRAGELIDENEENVEMNELAVATAAAAVGPLDSYSTELKAAESWVDSAKISGKTKATGNAKTNATAAASTVKNDVSFLIRSTSKNKIFLKFRFWTSSTKTCQPFFKIMTSFSSN